MTDISINHEDDKQHNQTIVQRGLINANWQHFLQNSTLADKTTNEKRPTETNKQRYNGPLRRDRKKEAKLKIQMKSDENNLNNIKVNSISSPSDTVASKTLDQTELNLTNNKKNQLTKFIAMDCEMVGIGYDGNDNMLARVSLVNKFCDCIYDKFVKPREEVIDYRTSVSGIRREDMINGEEFSVVQKEVSEILRGRVLVGHSLNNDLNVLFLSHPDRNKRDTSKFKPFRKITNGNTPSLKRLVKEILNIDIQHGEHNSVEDAKAAMQLYCTVAKKWEATLSDKRGYNRKFLEKD